MRLGQKGRSGSKSEQTKTSHCGALLFMADNFKFT
jgi:hypothetical protein